MTASLSPATWQIMMSIMQNKNDGFKFNLLDLDQGGGVCLFIVSLTNSVIFQNVSKS